MDLSDFYDAPSAVFLDTCKKDQLLEIAEHYDIVVREGMLKDELKVFVLLTLFEKGVLQKEPGAEPALTKPAVPVRQEGALSFHQQRELLLLQLELEQTKLRVLDRDESRSVPARDGRDLSASLRLVPKFNERDPDTFFTLFERVSETRQWPDEEKVLLLQCVLTGKAQEAYSAVCAQEGLTYEMVKLAVLRAYELVPEAYRQRFRQWVKSDKQTCVEFVRDLTSHFHRWCAAEKVDTFEGLSQLIIMEQFKNVAPQRVAAYLNERDPATALKAAELADDFLLTHKAGFTEVRERVCDGTSFTRGRFPKSGSPRGASASVRPGRSNQCNFCRGEGHWKDQCPLLKRKNGAPSTAPVMLCASAQEEKVVEVDASDKSGFEPFIIDAQVSLVGSAEIVNIRVLRDTGARHSFIVQSVLPFSADTQCGDYIVMRGMELGFIPVPRHDVMLECNLAKGVFSVGVRPELPLPGVSMILGNDICGGRVWPSVSPAPVVVSEPLEVASDGPALEVFPVCAVTRAQSKVASGHAEAAISVEAVTLPKLPPLVSKSEWIKAQKSDSSLSSLWEQVVPRHQVGDVARGYFVHEELLVRKWVPCVDDMVGVPVFQVVVPQEFRSQVLRTAHDESGHFGVRKTYLYVLKHFFWPRAKKDVAAYIKTCHVCQLTGKPNQRVKPAPLQPIPVACEPFEYLIVDCVGPLPTAKSGCNYLLTVMCQRTRYPAAYPLRSITTKAVVKALSQFISVFGIPKVIQSDRGSNFCSHMFAQVLKMLGVNHNQSTPYHAQSQGALERFHQTLKSLLRAYCTELNRDWEDGLPWLMLAAREAVQESTGFSPNELVFGHSVRGPLAALKDGLIFSEVPSNLIDYVNGFRHRLFHAGLLAREKLEQAQNKMKVQYDRGTVRHEFSPGDQVLALAPLVTSPFQAKFVGPYTVSEKVSDLNYRVGIGTHFGHYNTLRCTWAERHL